MEQARQLIFRISGVLALLFLCLGFSFISFSTRDDEIVYEYEIKFDAANSAEQMTYVLHYNTDGKNNITDDWGNKQGSLAQLPEIPKETLAYYTEQPIHFMAMYIEKQLYITVYYAYWGRIYGDWNYSFAGGSHTWFFDNKKNKWEDAPANIQLPKVYSKEQ